LKALSKRDLRKYTKGRKDYLQPNAVYSPRFEQQYDCGYNTSGHQFVRLFVRPQREKLGFLKILVNDFLLPSFRDLGMESASE
jgi:hypothetical protein